MLLPIELENLIFRFAWNKNLSKMDILEQIDALNDIHDSIPFEMLNPLVWETQLAREIPNPYIDGFPFHPLNHINSNSIWMPDLLHLPSQLNRNFYHRNRTYRSVFNRHLRRLYFEGFTPYNQVLARYLIHIQNEDFVFWSTARGDRLIQLIDRCVPLQARDFPY